MLQEQQNIKIPQQPLEVYKSEYNESAVKKIILIQSWYKGIFTRAQVKRMCKDFYKRQMIIKQLLETEEKYIRDVSIVISDFQAPLLKKKIIDRQQSNIIFSNIDQIRRLNELFFACFFSEAQNYFHYKIIFEKVQKQIHFFKLYFQYFNNFNNSSLLVDKLTQNNKQFSDFLNSIRINPKYQLLTLKDYLIKPVQRLPKYVLIMKQIKKRTPLNHPDYKNINRMLRMFEEVNHSNNQKLNKVVNSYKINELERKLLLPHTISQPGVEFISEQSVTTLDNQGSTVQCTMYLINTEIIIAKKVKDRQIFLLNVPFKNGGGLIMFNDDLYLYKDSFTVQNGQGDSCTFICNSRQDKDALVQKIFSQLMKAEQKNYEKLASLCSVKNKDGVQFLQKMSRLDLLPQVQILGTQERNDPMFKYTIYIIQVRIKNIKQKLFLRFSQLLIIQKVITEQYGLTVKNYLVKNTWLMNHKPKLIEERKMAIQRFLKELLSKQEIIERGQEILVSLGLARDFYKLPGKFKEADDLLKKSTFSQRSTNSQDNKRKSMSKCKRMSIFQQIQAEQKVFDFKHNRSTTTRLKRLSIQQILQANQLNLGHYTRYTQVMNIQKIQNQSDYLSLNVLIPWIQNQKGFVKQRVRLHKDQRVICLLQKLAQQINLRYYKDFRLYLQRQYAGRLLDGDESISKIHEQITNSKYLLILKKIIYIDPEMQQRQIRADRVRLKIVSSQIIYDCKKDKYLINYNLILKLAILVGIAQIFSNCQQDEIENMQEFVKRKREKNNSMALKVRDLIASNYTQFHDATSTWQQDYDANFQRIFQKLVNIGNQNSIVFRTSRIAHKEKQYNTTQISQLAANSIIILMKNQVFFGSVSFVVQISHFFQKILKQINKQQCHQAQTQNSQLQNRNCWLIIKYNEIFLYSITLQQKLYCFTYHNLYKIQTYPSSIFLFLREKEVDFIKLKATNSYSIREMITYYRHYNDMINKMEEDQYFQESVLELMRDKNFN